MMMRTVKWIGFGCLGLGLCALVACGSETSSPKQVQTIVSNAFTSDPTLQDSNGDGVLDWVIRDHEAEHFDTHLKSTIQNGVLHMDGTGGDADLLDSRPRMDYPDHTELVWSARVLDNVDMEPYPVDGSIFTAWNFPGAQTWINFDYDVPNAHWAAVFVMIYRYASQQILYVVNQVDVAPGSTDLGYRVLHSQAGLPLDEFVDVKLHLYISESKVGLTVNGVDQGKLPYERKFESAPKDDRFITIWPSAPGATAEWKHVAVQVAQP